ncbi:hypothetical protein H6F96_09775 [Microcoleus sp. FACHB-53]|nr:hypothetical protein [Microcoleus sp. FACHB-53]
MWKQERLTLLQALKPTNFGFWILENTDFNRGQGLKIDPFNGSCQF